MSQVITFFGKLAERSECRHIKGHFYKMGTECILVEGQWHRINNSKIGFDLTRKTWVLQEDIPKFFRKVLIDIDNGMPIYGYMPIEKEDKFKYVLVTRNLSTQRRPSQIAMEIQKTIEKGINSSEAMQNYSVYCERKRSAAPQPIDVWYEKSFKPKLVKVMNELEESEFLNYYEVWCEEENAIRLGHIENPEDGVFYLEDGMGSGDKKRLESITTYQLREYGRAYTTIGHRYEELTLQDSSTYVHKLRQNDFDILVSKFIPYTFGIEHETIQGFIAERRLARIGLIPLRDGSLDNRTTGIAGLEYTTIPLRGELGLRLLREQARLLTKHCLIDNHCAFHIHFSGFPLTWKYVMNLYRLCLSIEKEMYQLFPAYKRNAIELIGASKEYTAPLVPMINEPLDLMHYLYNSMDLDPIEKFGMSYTSQSKVRHIPLKYHPRGEQKWNRPGRYHWINFEPVIFSPPQTIEFRLHTPTTNFTKMVAWLLICSAILLYAEYIDIGKESVDLTTIINKVFSDSIEGKLVAAWLIQYIEIRKDWYKNNKDKLGVKEIELDKLFSMPLNLG